MKLKISQKYTTTKMIQKETENLNSQRTSKKSELVIKNLPQRKARAKWLN